MKKLILILIIFLTSCNLQVKDNKITDENTDKLFIEVEEYSENIFEEKVLTGSMLIEEIYEIQSNIEKLSGNIVYLEVPKLLDKLGFFNDDYIVIAEDAFGSYFEKDSNYYLLGNIKLNNGKDAELIMLDTTAFYSRSDLLYFVSYDGKYYFIPSISQTDFIKKDKDLNLELINYSKKYISEKVLLFEEEKFLNILKEDYLLKENITFFREGKYYNLKFIGKTTYIFDVTNLEKIDFLSNQENKEFYIEKSGDNKSWGDENYRKLEKLNFRERDKLSKDVQEKFWKQRSIISFFKSDAIFLKMPDNTTVVYNLVVDFVEDMVDGNYELPKMYYTSNLGDEKNLEHYSYKETSSCGVRDGTYMYVPDGKYKYGYHSVGLMKGLDYKEAEKLPESELLYNYKDSDLVESGNMENGEKIYFFKDKNNPFLKAMYKYGYYAQLDDYGCLDKDTKFKPHEIECGRIELLNYDEFVDYLPVFFWKDPFERTVMFLSRKVSEPSACGAKPVIYLYPEDKIDISVTLDWNKKMLTSIPNYTTSWEVTSDEFSNIYDKKSGKIYPYLFWEDLMNYKTPEKGFVVKKERVSEFLEEKLLYVGLNSKEIYDFKDYWIPYMQESNYYFITFLQTKDLDKIVPITITPKPDSLFRIFMDFEGMNNYKKVEELEFDRFERNGFSVIEWGGKYK